MAKSSKKNAAKQNNSTKDSSKPQYAAAIDLGGTKVLAAIVDENHTILATAKIKTDVGGGAESVIAQMAAGVLKAAKKAKINAEDLVAVGACAPGPVNPATGMVSRAVNLGWTEPVALGDLLSKALGGTPVFVENDVNAGVYGSVVAGVAKGKQDVVGIFVGTGIGGGLVLGGELRRGARWGAGELGHAIIMADGPVCGCGNRGCIESLASRTALERDLRLALDAGRESIITELMAGKDGRMTSSIIAAALEAGDPLMTELMGRSNRYLGLFTASIVNILDPEMVVFGGGVVEKLGDAMLDPIRTVAEANYLQKEGTVEIVAAQLSDNAAIIGVAALAREAYG